MDLMNFSHTGKEEKSIGSYKHIGYVPKEYINEILKYWNDSEITNYYISIFVVGGKYKHCDIDDYGNNKIETAELTYGLGVNLAFHNNIVQKEENVQTNLKPNSTSINPTHYDMDNNNNNDFNSSGCVAILIILVSFILFCVCVFNL